MSLVRVSAGMVAPLLENIYKSLPDYDTSKCESPMEEVMLCALEGNRIPFEQQKAIGRYHVDFFIQPNIVIKCGPCDKGEEKHLFSQGYILRSYSEDEIKHNTDTCIGEIKSLMEATTR